MSGPCFAPPVYQLGRGDETQYCHVGGAYEQVLDAKMALGDITVKLQLTFFPLPATHEWSGKSIFERLELCGWRLLEIEVKAAESTPSKKRTASPGIADASHKKQKSDVAG